MTTLEKRLQKREAQNATLREEAAVILAELEKYSRDEVEDNCLKWGENEENDAEIIREFLKKKKLRFKDLISILSRQRALANWLVTTNVGEKTIALR